MALKLVATEAQRMESYRLAKIQAATEMIASLEKQLKAMDSLMNDMSRDRSGKDYELMCYRNTLKQLMDGNLKYITPPLEEAIDE